MEAVIRCQVTRDVLTLAVDEMPQAVGTLMETYVEECHKPRSERDKEYMAYLLRATDEATHLALLVSSGLGSAAVMAGEGGDQISEGQFKRLSGSALFACNLPKSDLVQAMEFRRQEVLQTPWKRLKQAVGLKV